VVRANREGARVLGYDPAASDALTGLLSGESRAACERFLRDAFAAASPVVFEAEAVRLGEAKILRFTAAPLAAAGASTYLVLLVDDITRAKRLEAQMLQTERLTMAGRMAAGVAHELNNPLATIAGCAESLLGRAREAPLAAMPAMDDFRHYLGLVEEEAYRCKELTSNLLRFVRDPGGQRTPTDLNELVRKAIELLQHQSRFAGRRIVTELEPDLAPVTVNEGQLRQVVLGIASNALEAMEADGVLTVRTRRHRDGAALEFEDQGVGIPGELLPRIFDPFVTTKPPGQGTGLGLAIAQGIVADHGGRIEVTSERGKGSLFRVVIPA
jgi:signal transduction histidine kinase